MDKYLIEGGKSLNGELQVYKAKNCVLALLAASILTDEKIVLHNCPKILDVFSMIKILCSIGVTVMWQGDSIIIDSSTLNSCEIPSNYAKEIRSSIFLMGSILGRTKKAKAVFPGGCDIGIRPIDLHLKGLRTLGIQIEEYGGYLLCDGENARGNNIHLDFPSVGATENIILASVLTKGHTTITNVAKEPEIVALQDFLLQMGANIHGAGGSVIEIEGVEKLHGAEFTPIPDRIVAGTYLIAGAICGGDVTVTNCSPLDMTALISKLQNVTNLKVSKDSIRIRSNGRLPSIKMIETQPYPGFPTDLQAQILTLQCVSNGVSMIVENMFETRYKHVGELVKMGADVVVRDRTALITGVSFISGAEVNAFDLRGGAALVLAGICAKGVTTINNIRHIERGYLDLDESLNNVGANIKKI